MNDATKHISATNRIRACLSNCSLFWQRDWDPLTDALVRSSMVVILDVLGKHSSHVPLADYEQVVQAFFSYGSNPAFSEGIGSRRSAGSEYSFDALRLEYRIEGSSEFGVSVVDQEAHG